MMGEYSPTVKPSTAQVESATASSATAPAATSAAATSAAGASTSAAVEEEPQYIFTREQLIEFANGPPKPPKYPRPDDLSPYYQPVTLHPSRANDPLSLSLKDMADKIGMVLIDHNITREMERREGIIRRDPAKELIESSRSNSVTSIQSRDQCLTEGSSDTKQCGPLETKQSGSHASESEKSLSKTDASIPLHKEQSPERKLILLLFSPSFSIE